jgi:predicted dehydrogenase
MLRLAIVGCGQISDRFFKQTAARGDARMVAACARHLESAQRKAGEYGVEGTYDDYERMYDEVKPDGVVIATPHSLHAAPAIAALKRGIHVMNEKPMATSLEDCRAMVEASEAGGALLMCLPFDHNPAFLTALPFLSEARLGKFTGAEAVLLIPGPPRDNWYYDRSIAHGGALLDCLVYPVSRLIALLGPAKRVVGDGKTVDSDVDDNVTLLIEWADGQQAVARTLWGTSFVRNDTTIYGRKGTIWLTGGQVVVHSPQAAVPGGEPVEWQGFKDCFRVPISPETPNESIIDHFVASIQTGTPPRCDGRMQLHVHEILFKGRDAAATGQTQELETTFDLWHPVSPAFYNTRDRYL